MKIINRRDGSCGGLQCFSCKDNCKEFICICYFSYGNNNQIRKQTTDHPATRN